MEQFREEAVPSVVMAEKAVLSCIMREPGRFAGRAIAEGLDADAFFVMRVFRDCLYRYLGAHPDIDGEVDLVGICTWLQMEGLIDRVGGPFAVSDVAGYATSPGGWAEWAAQLRECKARRLALNASRMLADASDSTEAIETAKNTLEALTAAVSGKLRAVSAKVAAQQFLERLESDHESGDIPGASTGIEEIDSVSGGMRSGEFWVVGGKPSRGKSVLMLQIGAEFVGRGDTVAVFSLEMMTHEVIGRLVSVMGRAPYGSITQPRTATKGDLQRIQNGVKQLVASGLWVDSSPGQTIESIQTESERIRDVTGSLSLVVVDYLQLIRGHRQRGESREEEIARVSGGLKQLAKRLGCPVMSASQLNEQGQTRESRAIEQDADALLFIVEDGLKIGKLRNGQRDAVLPLFLDGSAQKFTRKQIY
jgi:replicative DNA helicase